MSTNWIVTRDYTAPLPGEGAPLRMDLKAGTVVAGDAFDGIVGSRARWTVALGEQDEKTSRVLTAFDTYGNAVTVRRAGGADLIAWINRDSPGTLEPTDKPADAEPKLRNPYSPRGVGSTL